MAERVMFWVNGKQVHVEPDRKTTLLDYLRDTLHLMGTKNGCGTGGCGACTVIIDGLSRRSCQVKLSRMEGRKVETIESLASKGVLHPIQSAFIKTGAIQCGFCTPGMIMATKALLDQNPKPDRQAIEQALRHNVCRCTGYVKIIDAVMLAAREMQNKAPAESRQHEEVSARIGQSIPDYDALEKVRGAPVFAADQLRENMVFGKVVWSRFPHAVITKIDTAEAKRHPGVKAVLTAEDIPGSKFFGRIKADNPILCSDRVRFLGDAVALVFADTLDAAGEAAGLVKVEYEELPGVFTIAESMKDGAPSIHEGGNICKHIVHEVGDVDKARQECSHVVTGHFETVAVDPAYLEPDAGLGLFEEGLLTVYLPTQSPFHTRQ